MAEVSVEHLRRLRDRVRELLAKSDSDLVPFLNADKLTFRRKPDSEAREQDVNVTTTCSCLMALVLTKRLHTVYKSSDNPSETSDAKKAFQLVVKAPWMSSGLIENNAFTTTLVLRTLGFLYQERILNNAEVESISKQWVAHLGINNIKGLSVKLKSRQSTAAEFIWQSLSDETRRRITETDNPKQLQSSLVLELGRLIQTAIYTQDRFPSAQGNTIEAVTSSDTTYKLAAANKNLLAETFEEDFETSSNIKLSDIAKQMMGDIELFRINDYPEAAAVVYWLIDAVARANLKLNCDTWRNTCQWASDQFNHERSLVAAGHAARMDPIAMAMWACVCSRLRHLSSNVAGIQLGISDIAKYSLAILPSRAELEHSILDLWKYQTEDGIWPKYFPIFHYQDAGSNFCFTYELLEAVLIEFGRPENELLDNTRTIQALDNAVTWCEANKLKSRHDDTEYNGWNSGGNLETLRKGQPESWATAVIHMFLWELDEALSWRIQSRILKKYNARALRADGKTVADILDIEILIKRESKSLKRILRDQIIEKHKGENPRSLFGRRLTFARSALLFGPPGTSKTQVTEAVARDLCWPLIQIDPSHFLRNGLDQIYIEANNIFEDLMDLSATVILFDEMDALVQTRDGALNLDTTAQFLTTFMLPKLTALHDHGKSIFFMATNFQERFDAAIKRAGRFDLLLCMGPPTLDEKIKNLHVFLGERCSESEVKKVAEIIRTYAGKNADIAMQLELYTFGEFRSFIKNLYEIHKTIEKIGDTFPQYVTEDSADAGLRISELQPINDYVRNTLRQDVPTTLTGYDALQIPRKEIKEMTAVVRYILDRQESKQQD